MKYLNTMIGFREFPDEISLLINITGCCWHCPGCHSPELRKDIGKELTITELDKLIEDNYGITCIGFMGGDNYISLVNSFANYIKNKYPKLKVGWYSGNTLINKSINLENFDFIKLGPYIEGFGPIDNPHTNQRMYKYNKFYSDCTIGVGWRDITNKFWKYGREN